MSENVPHTDSERAAAMLDQLDALRAAATPGEWATDERRPADVVNHKDFPVAYAVTTLDRNADAALIVAAVNNAPRLVAALRGVLGRHHPVGRWAGDDHDLGVCATCFDEDENPEPWPCPTHRHITAALTDGTPR